jgi:hypothetical protein
MIIVRYEYQLKLMFNKSRLALKIKQNKNTSRGRLILPLEASAVVGNSSRLN